MRALFCVSGIGFLLFSAGADSLLDKLGFVWFFAVGLLLLCGMLAGSMSRR